LVINPAPDPDGSEPTEWRGTSAKVTGIRVSVENLADHARAFIADLSRVFADLGASIEGYELAEIEVSAAITVSGQFSLVGVGSGLQNEGTLKFKFRAVDQKKTESEP
jgi:hypothetical protein